MLKGEIKIIIRDAATGEVVDEITQPNIVTNTMFRNLIGTDPYIRATIVATSTVMGPSRIASIIPGNIQGSQSVVGMTIPLTNNPDFFPKNGLTPAFAQWSTRLDLPVSNRTISTVLLTDLSTTPSTAQA